MDEEKHFYSVSQSEIDSHVEEEKQRAKDDQKLLE